MFNFNSLAAGATPTQINNYMNGVLGCGGCVTVTGAAADRTYNGEGFVVGPGTGSTSLTLGNSNGATSNSSTLPGATDTFLANTNDKSVQLASQITITFNGGYSLSGIVSFDFEIFPDGTTSQPPDFTFNAWDGGTLLTTFSQLGVVPSAGGVNGSSTHSPNHMGSHVETNAQWIGTYTSGQLNHMTKIELIDWPATIGVDNLQITNNVPEPTSIVLLGSSLLVSLTLLRRKMRKQQ